MTLDFLRPRRRWHSLALDGPHGLPTIPLSFGFVILGLDREEASSDRPSENPSRSRLPMGCGKTGPHREYQEEVLVPGREEH